MSARHSIPTAYPSESFRAGPSRFHPKLCAATLGYEPAWPTAQPKPVLGNAWAEPKDDAVTASAIYTDGEPKLGPLNASKR